MARGCGIDRRGTCQSFFVETYFSGAAFRLFRWQVPETRKRNYLEWLLAREDFVKEVKLFGTGELVSSAIP